MRNSLGWAYPAGAEHDPRAPYNQPDAHHEDCNANEDSPLWDDPQCTECGQLQSEGLCWVWDAWFTRWLPDAFKGWLTMRFWVAGRFPSYCNCPEPSCNCEDLDANPIEPDWDAITDERRERGE